jgi:hypothetical protein
MHTHTHTHTHARTHARTHTHKHTHTHTHTHTLTHYTHTGVPPSGGERRAWIARSAYFYAADPYDNARLKAKEDKAKARPNVSENPWKCSSFTVKGGPGKWGGDRKNRLYIWIYINTYICI